MDSVNKWKKKLGLEQWCIATEQIRSEQVLYDKSCPKQDRFFIGIDTDTKEKRAIIYHDIALYEEAIVHELLHVKHPSKSEEWINEKTIKMMKATNIADWIGYWDSFDYELYIKILKTKQL